jgi:hypothetical protein
MQVPLRKALVSAMAFSLRRHLAAKSTASLARAGAARFHSLTRDHAASPVPLHDPSVARRDYRAQDRNPRRFSGLAGKSAGRLGQSASTFHAVTRGRGFANGTPRVSLPWGCETLPGLGAYLAPFEDRVAGVAAPRAGERSTEGAPAVGHLAGAARPLTLASLSLSATHGPGSGGGIICSLIPIRTVGRRSRRLSR